MNLDGPFLVHLFLLGRPFIDSNYVLIDFFPEKIDEFLSDIYYDCIFNVYEYLTNDIGSDVKDEFKDYLNL